MNHSGIKIEISTKKIFPNHTNTWKINNLLLKEHVWVNNRIKAEMLKVLSNKRRQRHNIPKSLGYGKSSVTRKVDSTKVRNLSN